MSQTTASSVATDYLYDGDRLVAEYNGSTLLRRYVHGPGVDEPLVWYEGSGLTDRRYLITDQQGSVIAEDGATVVRYSYGPYGEPNAWTGSRFRYTGQIALPEIALYHYKARVYDPVLGRFLQTDPVGYQDDFDLYTYAASDPLNKSDPNGKWVWIAVGAALSGGIQAYSEYQHGAFSHGLNSPQTLQALGRIGVSAAAGAIGGGAAGAIGRAIVGEGAAFIVGRLAANAAVGATTGAGQAEANARIESGGAHGATTGQLESGAVQGAAFSAAGSAAGDVAGRAAFNAAGGATREAAVEAAENSRMVNGQGWTGGADPMHPTFPNLGPSPGTPPSQVGAVVGHGTGAVVSAAQCPTNQRCP